MEALQRTFAQFRDLLNGMAPSQRLTFVAIPLLVCGALAAMMYSAKGPAEDYLLAGKSFSAEELKHAEKALWQAGLTQFHVEGQKLKAAAGDVLRYNAALIQNNGMPNEFGAVLDRLHEKFNVFTSAQERHEMLEIAKGKELSRIIRAIPGVEDASVIWERSKDRSFGGRSKVTATVSVRMRRGQDLTPELARSLSQAVASSVADLAPEDVAVLDTSTGRTIRAPDKDDPFNSHFIDQVRKFTALHQKNIEKALDYIPGIRVAVNVDLENLKTSWEQERKFDAKAFQLKTVEQNLKETSNERRPNSEPGVKSNTPRSVGGASTAETSQTTDRNMTTNENVPVSTRLIEKSFEGLVPKAVQVTVAIPRDYYRAVALKQGATETEKESFETRVDELQKKLEPEVRQTVQKLIPAGSPADAVTVNSFVDVNTSTAAADTPLMLRLSEAVSQWGGAAGLALFALWALWMLNRTIKRLPELPAPAPVAAGKPLSDSSTASEEDDEPKELTKRDQLQLLVRDNPEMAASVINRWIVPTVK